jgi:hypothetical protein
MQTLKYHAKGYHVKTVERFYIQTEDVTNNHLNDNYTIFHNATTILPNPIAEPTPQYKALPPFKNTRPS